MSKLIDVNVVTALNDSDYIYINNGNKTNQITKSNFQDSLDVTSTQVLSAIVNDTTTAITVDSTDVNKWIRSNNGSPVTVTINAAASQGWSLNDVLYFFQLGAGAITIAAGSGVTLNGVVTTTTQYQSMACIYVGNDTWDVVGVV